MTPRRRAAPPPDLPGFTFVEPIGSGGFADVHLFEQHMPRRKVAVKVLHVDRMNETSSAEFTAEANLMALLSTHPSIVTIYGAGESPDGRPYLVMEYAPRPNLQKRYKLQRFAVPEALRVGVQVSAAVETAHRAGIMHRDIKPANILVTEYNHPALTDFGIASTSAHDMAAGVSIPWSAPELFADKPYGGPEADVYALAATIYTLLAGHSPFEGGGSVSSIELIDRIENEPVPALLRQDIPPSLAGALIRAMAKHPQDRYGSALMFARALQRVQIELALDVTPIDIIDDSAERELEDGEADGLTRVRGVMSIAPTAPVPPSLGADDLTVTRARFAPAPQTASTPVVGDGGQRSAQAVPRDAIDVDPRGPRRGDDPGEFSSFWSSKRAVRGSLLIGAIVVIGVVGATVGSQLLSPVPTASSVAEVKPQHIDVAVVPAPTDLSGTISGSDAVFTWTNPDPQEGDLYVWSFAGAGEADKSVQPTQETTVTVPLVVGTPTCIDVSIVRAEGGRTSRTPARACAS